MSERKTLTERQTAVFLETIERVLNPKSEDDVAVAHAMRFHSALATARELIPAATSCLESASAMMAHQDQPARVMWLGMQVVMGLTTVMDGVALNALEGRLQDMAEYLDSLNRPQGRPS